MVTMIPYVLVPLDLKPLNALLNLKQQGVLLFRHDVEQSICTLWSDDAKFRY